MKTGKLLLLILALTVFVYLLVKNNRSNMNVSFGKYQDGHTLKSIASTTYENCKSVCDSDTKCAGFVIVSANNSCELKTEFPSIVEKPGHIMYQK